MDLLSKLTRYGRLKSLAESRAGDLEAACSRMRIPVRDARLLVMWGGGKDSTLALLLSKAVCLMTGSSMRAVTMLHPGLTPGTFDNIRRIRAELGIEHEWRVFLKPVVDPTGEDLGKIWSPIHMRLAHATGFHPRFMCVACNLGSVVVEYQAMKDSGSQFRITGNPPSELAVFEEWAASLKRQFTGQVVFPEHTGATLLDYYRLWWAVYDVLLTELSGIPMKTRRNSQPVAFATGDYLFEYPAATAAIANAVSFSVLEDDLTGSHWYELLTEAGWCLPSDLPGGTESDCVMPAAIAKLDIQHYGLTTHLEHLARAGEVLHPRPEMLDRAVAWARSGRSSALGERLLAQMGVPEIPTGTAAEGHATPVATALVRQLLPVR